MSYPEWVLKHKKKGTYINKVGNNYYLYAAHSEHIPGTANKSRRICDGYLGKITEKDGFIPKKKKESPLSLEYGLSCAITSLCKKPFLRIEQDYPDMSNEIIIRSILLYIYGENSHRLQQLSFISSFISDSFPLNEQIDFLIQRTSRMIHSTLTKLFPTANNLSYFTTMMSNIHIIKINKDWVISKPDNNASKLIETLHIKFEEDDLWKRLLR